MAPFSGPFDHGREQVVFQFPPVPDKVVINKKDITPESGLINVFKFPEDMFSGFSPEAVPQQCRDFTKFAVVWATPGVLDA